MNKAENTVKEVKIKGKNVKECVLKTRYADMDSFKHINNAAYFTYFEEARWSYFMDLGYKYEEYMESDVLLILAKQKVRYLRQLIGGEEITIKTGIEVKKATIIFYHYLFRNDILIAEGTAYVAAINREGKPTLIPPTLKEALIQ